MKKIAILSIFSLVSLTASIDTNNTVNIQDKREIVKEYQKMFEQISKKREGLDSSEIEIVKQPFLTLKTKKHKKEGTKTVKAEKSLILDAIFNKKAMINGVGIHFINLLEIKK